MIRSSKFHEWKKLWIDTVEEILSDIKIGISTVTTLTNKYNISSGTGYNIKKMNRLLNRSWRKNILIINDEQNNLVDSIKLFISKSSEPYTINDNHGHLDEH